jgi:hypothetical protein
MERKLLLVAVLVLIVLTLSGTLLAAGNQYGVADRREISLDHPAWVGGVLLPSGTYEVRHSMEGEDHIMLFRQMNVKRPAEVRVKCTLTAVTKPIERTEIGFRQTTSKEFVLNRLAFKGDRAEHRF